MSGPFQIPDKDLENELDYVLQLHTQASRGGRTHADFRFGNPESGAESYALPKGRLPGPREKFLAINTEIHPHGYMKFHGSWGRGGKKNTVDIAESGRVSVSTDENGNRTIEITGNPPRRFKLVKTKGGQWLFIGLDAGPVKAASTDLAGGDTVEFQSKSVRSGRFIDGRTGKTESELCVLCPRTVPEREKGLGGRFSLPFGLGMLFLDCSSFWMKDVPFDLDLVRLDRNFNVTEISGMRGSLGSFDLPVYRPKKRESVHAVELPAGYCDAKGILVGDRFVVGK